VRSEAVFTSARAWSTKTQAVVFVPAKQEILDIVNGAEALNG
jgi:hypothetical protein